MSLPTPTALQNFCSLIFGDHPLDLEQELIFWSLPDLSVEEDHLDPRSEKLFQQEHLVRVVAGKSIWAMHIDLIQAPCCRDIAQAFQSGANEGRPAVAIVHKLQFWRQSHPCGRNTAP